MQPFSVHNITVMYQKNNNNDKDDDNNSYDDDNMYQHLRIFTLFMYNRCKYLSAFAKSNSFCHRTDTAVLHMSRSNHTKFS